MNSKTVARGQVRTRVWRRGSFASASHQSQNFFSGRAAAVQQPIERLSEPGSAGATFHGIAQRHLFEGEQEIGSRFYETGSPCDFQRIAVQQLPKTRAVTVPSPTGDAPATCSHAPTPDSRRRESPPRNRNSGETCDGNVRTQRRRPWRALYARAARTAFGLGTLEVRIWLPGSAPLLRWPGRRGGCG